MHVVTVMRSVKENLLMEVSPYMSSEVHHDWLWLLNDRKDKLDVSYYTRHVCAAAEFSLGTDVKWAQATCIDKKRSLPFWPLPCHWIQGHLAQPLCQWAWSHLRQHQRKSCCHCSLTHCWPESQAWENHLHRMWSLRKQQERVLELPQKQQAQQLGDAQRGQGRRCQEG